METEKTESKKELTMPSKMLKVQIGINTYNINFPSNGQLIDIESYKIKVTNGTHKDMMFGSPTSRDAYLYVEAIATFTILLPKLLQDLTVKSLMDLDPLQSKSILKAYEDYYGWFQQWRDFINQDVE